MTLSEWYTAQFYTWEYRGRGWHVSECPVQLEPPFMPYFRHGYPQKQQDDGKRHTILSKAIENIRGVKKPLTEQKDILDYETLELFPYTEAGTLTALQITLPKDRKVSPEKMKALLIMLSNIPVPVSFEIIGTETAIILQFVCDDTHIDTIETYLSAFFPQYAISVSDAYLGTILRDDLATAVVDFGLKHEFVRPLHNAKSFAVDPLVGVMGVLERIALDEQAGIQVLFQPAVNHWSESIIRSVTMQDGSSFFLDFPEAPRMAQEKVQSPLYGVTIRTFAQAEDIQQAFHILERISFGLIIGSKGTYNELIPLSNQDYDFETRVADIFNRESHRLGMLLNVDELVSILHFPSESIFSTKLSAASRTTKEVPAIAKGKAFVLGQNVHNGIETPVTIGIEERLKHTHIIGATGTGKSTLIANLILQDIKQGMGVVVFDPHGDLIDDITAHLPPEKLADVVLVDPSDSEFPIGLNILEAHSDSEKEVLSSDLVASFRKYATSWGDQMNAVLGNAILALLESTEGGSLHDLRRFLVEKDYRNMFLKQVTDPSVLYYWHKEYPLQKSNSIGPILTRLDTFLRPKSIRNMLVQKTGLDFESLFNGNKIILLKLSQGLIGMENSYLLGSLILSKMHQAIFRRQQHAVRTPIFIYIDEFQHFLTPSIKDMLSGIRKYNVGLTLSHQDLQQLQRQDGELLNTVLGNSNTRIVFRVGEPDAKRLQDGFSGFDYTDLQNLGRGEAVVRIEQPQYDCSLDTMQLPAVSIEHRARAIETAIANSRAHYATSKDEVEQMLSKSFNLTEPIEEKRPEPPKQAQAVQKEKPQSVTPDIQAAIPQPDVQVPKEEKDISTHRYLQILVKKMAEARGYTATLELSLPDGSGQVDVLLVKENKTIAVEICNTTDPQWEMHNIAKCIEANYDTIISLSGDPKQLDKIKKKCSEGIANFENHTVYFFTPDALFAFLDETIVETIPSETNMKGFRINVHYNSMSKEEMVRKRASVAKVVMDSLRKRKKS